MLGHRVDLQAQGGRHWSARAACGCVAARSGFDAPLASRCICTGLREVFTLQAGTLVVNGQPSFLKGYNHGNDTQRPLGHLVNLFGTAEGSQPHMEQGGCVFCKSQAVDIALLPCGKVLCQQSTERQAIRPRPDANKHPARLESVLAAGAHAWQLQLTIKSMQPTCTTFCSWR